MTGPTWVGAAGIVGLFWHALALFQVIGSAGRTEADYIRQGETAAQAVVLAGTPVWGTAGFALGALAGIGGCILIARRSQSALPVLLVSLAGYAALMLANALHGVYAVTGPGHVIVNAAAVAVAAGLVAAAVVGTRRRILT